MRASDILAIKGKVLYTISPDKSLAEAIAIMSEHDVGSIVVYEGGKMVGMLTFREVLLKVHQNGKTWDTLQVGDAMLPDPLTAPADMKLEILRLAMITRPQRYIPVVDGSVLLGVISFYDVARAEVEQHRFDNDMLKRFIREWPNEEDEKSFCEKED